MRHVSERLGRQRCWRCVPPRPTSGRWGGRCRRRSAVSRWRRRRLLRDSRRRRRQIDRCRGGCGRFCRPRRRDRRLRRSRRRRGGRDRRRNRGRRRTRSRSRRRRRRWDGCRSRDGRGGRGWVRSWSRSLGKEAERVEVPLVVRGDTYAKVDVRLCHLEIARGSDGCDDLPIADDCATGDDSRAEVRERHGIAVPGQHRDDQPALRNRPDKAHGAGCGSMHALPRGTCDVDASVLASLIRVGAETERPKYTSARRPRPRVCAGRQHKRAQYQGKKDQPPHRSLSSNVFIIDNRTSKSSAARDCRQI